MLTVVRTFLVAVSLLIVVSVPQISSAALISSEDFEGGSSGWNDNSTNNAVPAFTEFLGRFSGTGETQSVFKTYALPGDQLSVIIEFDFYEIDSWDGDNDSADDSFLVYIDDNIVVDAYYYWWSNDDDSDSHSTPYAAPTNIGFAGWDDQRHHFVIQVPTTASSIKLGFGSGLDQDLSDESWGIDNVTVETSYEQPPVPSDQHPIPTLSKWGTGMLSVLLVTFGWLAVRRYRA